MAWTSPRTWTTGEVVTAALMNTHLRDNFKAIGDAWMAYTPTLGGFTLGNGVASGAYIKAGRLVAFEARFVFGSTSAAASAFPTLTLPSAYGGIGRPQGFGASFIDASTNDRYDAVAMGIFDSSAISIGIDGTNGKMTTPSTTTPFTWTTSDEIWLSGVYMAQS